MLVLPSSELRSSTRIGGTIIVVDMRLLKTTFNHWLEDRAPHEISVSSYAVIRTNCIVPFSVERVGTNIYLCDLLF